jgi:Bacterial Ig-like domain (group 3)
MTKFKRILTLGPASSRRRDTNYGCPRFHVILTALLLIPCFAIAQGQVSRAPQRNQPSASSAQPILSFTAPAPATVATDGTVTATLHLAGNADPSTLRVMLNKTNVTDWFSASACSSLPCNITAHLSIAAGVSLGWDSLYATLKGKTGNAGIAKARFYYGNGALNSASGTALAHAMDTASSRASVHPADTTPGTSTPLAVLPPTIAISMDPTAGLTLGSMNYSACPSGTPFTFFRFDRTTLQLMDNECLAAASLPGLIVGLQALSSNNIVFLFSAPGTPLGKLNFSTIGGTDFTATGAPIASSYQFVGYSQASPGEAYESYQDASGFNLADIKGNLVNAGASSAFYGFQPTDAPAFVTEAGGPNAYATITVGYPQSFPFGNTTPTNWSLPSSYFQQSYNSSLNPLDVPGLFVLTFSPTDFSLLSQNFYNTGTALSELNRLNAYLAAVTNGTIVLITSQGSNPFGSVAPGGPTPSLGIFCAQVSYMGVSEHACAQAGTSTSNGMFSMAGVMENPNGNGQAPATAPAPGYTRMYSSTYETGQNDSGSLKGLFKRNHQFHLVPYQVSSFDTSLLASATTWDAVFATFSLPTQVGLAPAAAWPMLDTPAHQAAYAYLSNAIVGKVLFANGTCTVDAAWCDDVRAWYAGSEVQTFAGLDLSASPAYAFPSSATAFTQSDFNDVKSQLQAEFIYLNNELNYESWFNSVTNGALLNTGSAFSAAANDVSASLISQYATITPPPISLASGLLGFAGDAVSLFGSLSPLAEEESVVFQAASTVGDFLETASSAVSLSGDQSGTDPSVVQVGDLIASVDGQASLAAAKYNLALQTQVSNHFASVRSDWFKLQTYGILTSQPSANGWYIQDTGGATASTVAALSTARARLSFYSQLLPQYFDMDWMFAVPVQGIVTSGTSLSVLNSQYIATYLGSEYYQGNGGTWPAPDFSQFSLPSSVNSTCQDYGLVVSQYSYQHYDGDDAVFLQSWQNRLGDVLMGPPSSADGLGNLNLSQNALYDFGFNSVISPVVKTSVYAPNQFNSLPWGENVSCPTGLGAAATAQLKTMVTAPPSATLTIQPSGSRVAPDGSVTVAVSVQPADPTVTLTPTGTMSIVSGTKIITAKSLTNGTPPVATATLKILAAFLSPGMYSLTVGYGGDSNFLGSTATMNLQVLVAAAATTTVLNMPAVAYQGQNVTFQTTVTSATGIPPGTVNFQDGTTSLGSAPLDSTGNASISPSNLGVGSHSITAVYSPTDNLTYAASQSQTTTLLINPVAQDMAVSLSASSVDVPDGAQSIPVKFTVSSVSAFAGQVSFACVGLPLGMTCNFSPSQGNLPASGALSTNLTIGPNTTTSSAGMSSWKGSAGLFGLILSALLAFRISRGRRLVAGVVCMWVLVTLGVAMLSGCGGSSPGGATHQSGTTNILVTATSGNITRNVPLTVNIQ